jgi:hypothetical protein
MSSVSGISSSLVDFQSPTTQSAGQTKWQQLGQDFQQLGQDLRSGNLTAAAADLGALQKLSPQSGAASTAFGNSPTGKSLNQLSQDLQSGNLSGAQQDYSSIQADIQNQAAQGRGGHHHHHHHHHGGGSSTSASSLSQDFQQLGPPLQSGNLSSAQPAYSALQNDLPQLSQTSGQQTAAAAAAQAQPSASGVSVSV